MFSSGPIGHAPVRYGTEVDSQSHLYHGVEARFDLHGGSNVPPIDEDARSDNSNFDLDLVLDTFWANRTASILAKTTSEDFKRSWLPFTRVKRIMKLDPDVQKVTFDAVAVLTEAACLFVEEVTLRSLNDTNDAKRRILRRMDVCSALQDQTFDFLIDILDHKS